MKKVTRIVGIFILVALLCVLVPSLVYAAITWESYQDLDHTTIWGGSGTEYNGTYYIVYMYGAGFGNNVYHNIGYYDNAGAKIATDASVKSLPPTGTLASQYDLMTDPTAAAGTWHAVVYPEATTPPETYVPGDPSATADDDFEVLAEAIPEFPTVISAIAIAGLCFGIYYWMRKRRLASYKVTG